MAKTTKKLSMFNLKRSRGRARLTRQQHMHK